MPRIITISRVVDATIHRLDMKAETLVTYNTQTGEVFPLDEEYHKRLEKLAENPDVVLVDVRYPLFTMHVRLVKAAGRFYLAEWSERQ